MEENSSRTTTGTQCSDSNDSASENRTKIVSCLLKSSASNGKRKSCQVSFDLLRNQCIKYNRFGTLIEPGTRILGYISSCGVAPGEDPNYKRSIHLLPSKQASEYFTPVRARRPSSFTFLISRPTDTDGSVSPRVHSQVLTGYSSCLYPTQFAAHRVQFSGHKSNPFFRHSAHCNGNVTLSKPRNVLPTESSQRCHTGKIKLAGRSMPAERLAQSNPCQACMHTVQ
ncbi:unnamed protein product [Dicrocoelium dendriticum]|nr:unnamed protein product [Dicrocoelium dendriticum]